MYVVACMFLYVLLPTVVWCCHPLIVDFWWCPGRTHDIPTVPSCLNVISATKNSKFAVPLDGEPDPELAWPFPALCWVLWAPLGPLQQLLPWKCRCGGWHELYVFPGRVDLFPQLPFNRNVLPLLTSDTRTRRRERKCEMPQLEVFSPHLWRTWWQLCHLSPGHAHQSRVFFIQHHTAKLKGLCRALHFFEVLVK